MPFFDEEFVKKRTKWWEEAFDKDAARAVMGLIYGGLYARTVLDPKVRQFCALSALTVVGAVHELEPHMKHAFRAGATEKEVKEVILQMIPYAGVPPVAEAYKVFKKVVEERKLEGKNKQVSPL